MDPSHTTSEWIELPGLFERDEFEDVVTNDIDVESRPLVIVHGRVLYGLYVRLHTGLEGESRSAA